MKILLDKFNRKVIIYYRKGNNPNTDTEATSCGLTKFFSPHYLSEQEPENLYGFPENRRQYAPITWKRKQFFFSDGFGTYRHVNYLYFWNGRQVILSYSKLNGCGSISFGMNKEEQEKAAKEREEERRQLEIDSANRLKRHPERLEKRIKSLKEQEESFLFDLSFDDNTVEDIEFYTNKLNEVRRLLNLYQS